MCVRYVDDPDRAITLKSPSIDDVAVHYPIDESITRFLTENDQCTVGSPESVCKGPNPLGLGSLPLGIYEGVKDASRLIGVGYILAPEHTYPGLGLYILDKTKIGGGYGSLAVHGLSRLVTECFAKPLVQTLTLEANERAGRSLARAGFLQTARVEPIQETGYGHSLSSSSVMRTWLLLKPGDYVLPEDKFRNPTPVMIEASRKRYVEMDQRMEVDIS